MDKKIKYFAIIGFIAALLIAAVATYIQQQQANEQLKQADSPTPNITSVGTLIPNPEIGNVSDVLMMGKLYMGNLYNPKPYDPTMNATITIVQGNETFPVGIYSNDSYACYGNLITGDNFYFVVLITSKDGHIYKYQTQINQTQMIGAKVDSYSYMYEGSQHYVTYNTRWEDGYTLTSSGNQLDFNIDEASEVAEK